MAKHEKFQPVTSFETHPSRYVHWKLTIDGAVATLALDVKEDRGQRPDDYVLKLNSYDLGVDIELNDAIERLRFEHPGVRAVLVTSAQPRIFCAGANIKMLASSTHGFKVNFCRYTNETRCGIEDASAHSGITFIAALNGTASGGGYELALAADKIVLLDDGTAAVSLPEVPLLGVLPGTGGLTRLVDKRMVRRDVADVFCTKAEGFRARDALRMKLIDASFPKSKWDAGILKFASDIAAKAPPRSDAGIAIPPLQVTLGENGARSYRSVDLSVDESGRIATITVRAPESASADPVAEGPETWSYRAFRELEDALLHLRFNHDRVGLVLLKSTGELTNVLGHDAALQAASQGGSRFAKEIQLFQARVLRRFDNTAKTFFAIVAPGSAFGGSLFELVLAADRSFMLKDDDEAVKIAVGPGSRGTWPMSTGASRLATRFAGEPDRVEDALSLSGPIAAEEAFEAGLVTFAPDDIDWDDEVRIAIEERVSLSPDALTGMEQNLRFVGAEGCDTKIFGRLSAWQNWIFQRPNAVGDDGALTLYGHPNRPKFDVRRT